MNMNSNEDEKWQSLLLRCVPTFAEESTPPYGFVTGTLARLRAEKRQQEECELIGWRVLLASFASLVIAATVTLSINSMENGTDFDPGVKNLVLTEHIQVS